MKKSAAKEVIITSVAAAVAGFVVKKGYDYFRSQTNRTDEEKNNEQEQLFDSPKALADTSEKVEEVFEESTPAQKGLVATLVYTATAFIVSKLLRKII